MYIETGNPLNYLVEFKGSLGQLEEPVSFTYSLVRLDGTIITTVSPVLPTGSTTYLISIAETALTKQNNGQDYDTIFLKISYSTSTKSYVEKLSYFVTDTTQYTVSPNHVRQVIGCSDLELSNEEILIFDAYLEVKNTVDPLVQFDTLLTSGGYRSKLANELILYRSAILNLPSLQLRLLQSHQEDNIVASRFKGLDLKQLEQEFERRYMKAYLALNGELGDVLVSAEQFDNFLVFNPTPDVITGA